MLQSIKQTYKKSFFLILLVLSMNIIIGDLCVYAQTPCSSIQEWSASNRNGSGQYNQWEQARLPGQTQIYYPQYSGGTTCHLTDANCRLNQWSQWIPAGTCVSCTAPAQPGAMTGSASVCASTGGLTYSVPTVSGATGYEATHPVGWTYTAGVISGGNVILTYTSGTAGQNGNISIRATNACGQSAYSSLAVTVLANLSVGAASSTPTLCINSALTNITHTTTGATGIGAASGLPSGVSAAWAGNMITISGTPTASGTFSYSIPLTGGCGAVNATGTITVNAASALGSPSTAGPVNFCDAGGTFPAAVTVSGQTGSVTWNWGSNNGAWNGGWVGGNSSGVCCFPKKVSSSDGNADRISYSVTNGVCPTVTSSAILISNYYNVAPSSITSNINNVCPSTSGTLTATFPNAVNMNGRVEFATTLNGAAFATITPAAGQTVFTTNVSPASTTTYYVRYSGISAGGAGCYSTSQSVAVTINALNTATAGAGNSQTLCINSALTNITIATTGATGIANSGVAGANGLPAGVSAAWSGNVITISGTPTASGTFNYSILLTGGCGTVNATGTITVTTNTAAAGAGNNQTKCINTALTNITIATTGATGIASSGIAGANGLPAGVSAAWAGNVITISGTPTAAGTFNYSILLTGGCGGAVNATGTITVTAANTAATGAGNNQTLCINSALTNITIATTGATGIGAATDLPAGVSAAWAGNVITISGTPTAAGTFNYSILLTGGCGTVSATGTITVNINTAAAGAGNNQTLCINSALTNITIATTGATGIANSGVSGGNGLPAGVSATWAANVITISGTPTASGTFNYSILLTGGCGTVNATGTITVNTNTAAAGAGNSQTKCINSALTNITIATTGATGIASSGIAGANGLPAGVSATWAGNVITISGTPTAAGTFNYSILLTGGCGTVSATGTITVTAANTAAAGAGNNQTVCINSALTNITIATTGATGIGAATDLPAGVSAAWAGNVITISGTPTASGTFSYSILLTGGCGTVSATGTITVNTPLVQGAIAADQTINANSIPSSFTSTTAASGGGGFTYQWQISTDNAFWANIGSATSATYTSPTALTQDTWYRRAATSTSCGTLYTTSVKVTVQAFVCGGSTPPAMNTGSAANVGGGGSPTYQWQISTDGTTYTDISSATGTTYTPGSVAQNMWYRRAGTINGCTGYSNALQATVSTNAPGGTSTGLIVWLKADAGTSNIGTQWEDQSGNGNHYTTVSGPTLVAGDSSSNFNPYVQILDGGFDAPVGAALGNNYTIFMVAKKLASDDNGRIFDGHTGNFYWGYAGQSAGATSKSLQTFTSSSGHANGIRVDINQGANTATEGSDAQVYELIIYNSVLSNAEINVIESYLRSKYRLGNQETYISSTSSTVFDVSTYANDIIGVGKECYFNQKQSRAQDDSCKIFISTLAATNAANTGTITNSPSYFMIGHDAAKLKESTAANLDIPPANTNGHTVTSRIAREWKVTNTNFDNDVTIKFIIENQSAVTSLNHLCLLVDDDGDFTSGCTVYGQGESGVTFSFGSIDVLVPAAIIPKGTTKFIALASKNAASKFTTTALPIVLTDFKAKKVNEGNLVSWTTSSEQNNSHFVLQKSYDGEHWHTLEEIDGAGNSTNLLHYHFLDREHCPSICYYQLKQVDYDGKFEFSKTISIENESLAETGIRIYPDPVGDHPIVDYYAEEAFEFQLEIYSIEGSIISESILKAEKGLNSFEVNTTNYSSGVYIIMIKDAEGVMLNTIKFIK